MNKIKQNKITFTLILLSIGIIFSSLTILSLPVLFNYESKVVKIEKNFYQNFKLNLKSSGNISYKPFPKPHLLVEKASINFPKSEKKDEFINTSNLKIFISLRDIYLRTFYNFLSAEISKTNIYLELSDIIKIRKHLYQKINKPIDFNDCKIFINNNKKEVILISPVNKILYKINNKTKIKHFDIHGEIFGLNFKSEWKRNYSTPEQSFHSINFYNPNIEIKNIFNSKENEKLNALTEIIFAQDKLKYELKFNKDSIEIISPNKKITNFNIDSKIQLNPFYFNGGITIKNKKVENIIDNFLLNLVFYDKNYLGNLSGIFKIKFRNLNNKLIKNGEINLIVNEQKINFKEAYFQLDKVGEISSSISFLEKKEEIKFISKNELIIKNHIEFAKIFQVGSKKIKNIKKIYFDLEKIVGSKDFILKNIKLNDVSNDRKSNEIFIVRNIQNLRSNIRKILD